MTKYRIMSNGARFKIQRKSIWTLWLVWMDWVDGDEWAIYATLEEAQNRIALAHQHDSYNRRAWCPISK